MARRCVMRGLQVVGNRLLLIDADVLGVGANISLVEDTAGKEIELFLFQGAEQASSNLCRGSDFVERDGTHLALATQAFAESSHLDRRSAPRTYAIEFIELPVPIIESGAGSVKRGLELVIEAACPAEDPRPKTVSFR